MFVIGCVDEDGGGSVRGSMSREWLTRRPAAPPLLTHDPSPSLRPPSSPLKGMPMPSVAPIHVAALTGEAPILSLLLAHPSVDINLRVPDSDAVVRSAARTRSPAPL